MTDTSIPLLEAIEMPHRSIPLKDWANETWAKVDEYLRRSDDPEELHRAQGALRVLEMMRLHLEQRGE